MIEDLRTTSAIDAADLPRAINDRRAPLWLAVLLLVMIEATVLGTIVVSYGYLSLEAETWPPAGTPSPDVLLPSINLVLLVASAVTMWWAGTGARRERRWVMGGGTALSVVLASVVLVLRWQQFGELGYEWDSHAFGSITWLAFGFHFVHVSAAIVGTAVVSAFAWRGYYTRERHLGIVVDSLYWYFVAVAWIPLYLITVWDPRLT